MAAIPSVLHQTWKTKEIPAPWRGYAESFAEHNRRLVRKLWTDEEARAFVADEATDLLALYDAYPYAILRTDLFRYLVLYRIGGIYSDLDVACLGPLDSLLESRGVVLASEPTRHARLFGRNHMVCNAFMASEPGHPFWLAVLDELQAAGAGCVSHRDVLELTGPLMLQRVLERFMAHPVDGVGGSSSAGMRVLPPHVANPFPNDHPELKRLRLEGRVNGELENRLRGSGSLVLHVWSNTWVGGLAGDLSNPDPHDVPGFGFFEGLDSYGHDIVNLGRNVREAARRCSAMPDAVAFNTDGFAKLRLSPRWLWQRRRNMGRGEGLYVKESLIRAWWRYPIPCRRR